MKIIAALGFTILWPLLAWGAYPDQWVELHYTSTVKDRNQTFYAEPHGPPPDLMAFFVESDTAEMALRKQQMEWQAEFATNHDLIRTKPYPDGFNREPDFNNAVWLPFKTNLSVDLGPGDGGRRLWVSYRAKNDIIQNPTGNSYHIFVQTSPPIVVFTNPKEHVTSQPMIQLKGYVTTDLGHVLHYQILDQNSIVTASGEGLVNDVYLDPISFERTTNYFTCYDLPLTQGTNTIVLQGTDSAGYSFMTNFISVFTTVGATNPPKFSLDWPMPEEEIPGNSFTIHGPSDNPTAKMTGQIVANGQTNPISALIERDGHFWYENVPLAQGRNLVTLTATDVAGNMSTTNFYVTGKNDVTITIDPVEPAEQLWWRHIKMATGKVYPANNHVWVNGIEATVKPDGSWMATNVPVISSPSGGTALFDLTTVPPGDLTKGNPKITEQLSSQASLGTNVMVLNASFAACGVFNLHLSDIGGHGFVIEASTNLTAWIPLLTNSDPNPTFDFTDTNANNYPCRFFRVTPTP